MHRIAHAKPGRKRALIVDEQPVFRAGLSLLLRDEFGGGVLEADGAASALGVVEKEHVDMATVELALGGEMSFSLIAALRACRPEMPILVISRQDEEVFAERAIASGASGYVSKREAADVIVRAIQRVLEGKIHVSAKVTERLLESLSLPRSSRGKNEPPLRLLTERETDVLRRMGLACSSAQIARELGISTKTVETHCSNIKEKLSLSSSRELVVVAVHWLRDGLLEAPAGVKSSAKMPRNRA